MAVKGWKGRLAMVVALGLCASGARAQSPVARDVTLDYRAPDACPDELAFRERAADAFGLRDPFAPRGVTAASRMRVEITSNAKGYGAVISVLDPNGKALSSSTEAHDNCDALVWVLGHRMAMIIVTPAAAPVPAPPAKNADDTEIRRRLGALEERTKDQEETIRALRKALEEAEKKEPMDLSFVLSAGALLTANLTSNPGPGAWVSGAVRTGPLSLGLELRGVFPSRAEVGPFDFDLTQVVALLTPCGRYSYFFGCAVAGAGAEIHHDSNYRSSSSGPPVGYTDAYPRVQLGGRLGVEVPFGDSRFAGQVWGEVLYATPPLFEVYEETGARWDSQSVSAFFGLGLVIKLGDEGAK